VVFFYMYVDETGVARLSSVNFGKMNEKKNDCLSLPSCFFDGGEVMREMSPTKNLQRERV
jgi:hypothetical protein